MYVNLPLCCGGPACPQYTTVQNNQTDIDIPVYEGERTQACFGVAALTYALHTGQAEPPARGVLVVWHSAREEGCSQDRYFVRA